MSALTGKILKLLLAAVACFASYLPAVIAAEARRTTGPATMTTSHNDFSEREKLRAHSVEFRKEVIQVADGVYVAVGYSASNVTLIQGDHGSIIVDTTANPVDAQAVVDAFGKRLLRPVRAIIYTHGHQDHTGGASVFAGNDHPDIYSHRLLVEGTPDVVRVMREGGDQFGMKLPESQFINAGVQLEFGRVTPPTRAGYLVPTHTFDGDQRSLVIAGVTLQLLHTPGESPDNFTVWLPQKQVAISGDLFLQAFPNLSPVRGLRLRPTEPWIASLEKVLALNATQLVPGHMRPISGADEVRAALTTYRDGIKSIQDQTLDGIRKGLSPDELVQQVKLPPSLADSPYLQEYYGSVAWSVRGIYADRVGWFDGNATHLFPLPDKDRAAKIIEMSGGPRQVLARARAALAAGEFQWAAELSDYLLAVDGADVEAKRAKAQALTELGERQLNATARNFYLSSAQHLLKDVPAR